MGTSRASKRPARRRTIAASVAIVCGVSLVACGDDSATGDEADASASSVGSVESTADSVAGTSGSVAATGSSAPASEAAFPVTIEHKFGSTTIDEPPERVVALGFNGQDFLLALGVEPVAVREYMGYDAESRPWAERLLDDLSLPTVGGEQINFEAVAAADPDLILGVYSFMESPDYQKLSKIAPTVAQTGDYPDGGVPWDEQMLATGEALGRGEEAADIVDGVNAEFAAARDENPAFEGATLALAYYFDDQFYVLEPTDLRMRFFMQLGFEAPPTTGTISNEQIGHLDHDVVVIAGATRDQLADDPLVAGLDASQEGRVVYLGGFDTDMAGALGFGSPLSLSYAIDTAVPLLAAAIDGDPATPVDDAPLWSGS